jgi:predicted membrane channel-forming protein YqfA (hemolysin III family)
MEDYKPNYILIMAMVGIILFIASSIIINDTAELWLLISGWIVLVTSIALYVLKIKKEDEDN